MITTNRLIISIASNDEMKELIIKEEDLSLKQAYGEMYQGSINHPDLREFYAVWFMKLKDTNEIIGDLSFKGISKDGMVEIGYGIRKKFEGKGYTTEAVIALVDYIRKNSKVKSVEAEIEKDNIASRRVLEKAGFIEKGEMGEEGPRFIFVGN